MPAQASRTINPLHFEDLEPHRFEDLIRQLAYNFREWSRIEATGRLGQDEGIDIRALEVVTVPGATSSSDNQEDEEPRQIVLDEREWRIQCKRYKQMGPKFVRGVVAEAVPDPNRAPYGIIIAAACDVSANTMTAFHEERVNRGVREGHLWTKAHLEDLLFLPENDHLLFAYFGISIGARRKSQVQQLQAMIALKRKLLRAFKKDSLHGFHRENIVIHDVSDSTYPTNESFIEYENRLNPPWFPCSILQVNPQALIVYRYSYDGWLKPDRSWDFLPDTGNSFNHMGSDFERELRGQEYWGAHQRRRELLNEIIENVPKEERVDVILVRRLPFSSILEVDPMGDIAYEGVHLYCRYGSVEGPFEKGGSIFACRHGTYGRYKTVEPEDHRPLFASLNKKRGKDGLPIKFIDDVKKWDYENL